MTGGGDREPRALRSAAVSGPSALRRLRARLRRGPVPATPDPTAGTPQEAWRAAIDGEVAFWRVYFETKGERYPGSYAERTDPDLPLDPDIAALIDAPHGATVRLLDVGAGPLTFLGRTHPGWTIEITAVDALGEQYAALIDEFGVTPPVTTRACESEKLTTLLPRDAFDLVAARNTLDHSYDPVLAISEMARCAKPGAPLLLIHHRNTAEDEQYHGMHQWNFEATDTTLVVWRPGTRTDVVDALDGLVEFDRRRVDGAWEHVVLRRTPSS
jgi:SAM-dependent methyltransferase